MKKISFFPRKQVTLASTLSTQDTYLAIKEETYIGEPSVFFPFILNTDEKKFKGFVEKDFFTVIKLPRSNHSSFLTDYLISGTVEPCESGSSISLNITLKNHRKWGYIIFYIIGLILSLFAFIGAIWVKTFPTGLLIILLFLVIGNIIERLIFNIVSEYLIKKIKDLLV